MTPRIQKKLRQARWREQMHVTHRHAAGIDIHANVHCDVTWSMAARTLEGQERGNGSWNAVFGMLTPGTTESSLTKNPVLCYGQICLREKSLD
jgi:hypothetical protein